MKLVLLICGAALVTTGCKKKGTTGGGGGGWFVGSEGLMVNVQDGRLGAAYDLGASETLYEIACRYQGEAWVVGAHGTLLYTGDGGEEWTAEVLPTTRDLRALATQDKGPVFIAGDGVFFTAVPEYVTGAAEWRQLGDGTTSFRALAAAQRGTTVLAVSDGGGVWSYENDRLVQRTTIAGAATVAVSPDGQTAILAGDGLLRSTDGGQTWTALTVDPTLRFEDVRVDDAGTGIAVGEAGAVARFDADGRVLVQRVGTEDLHTLHIKPSDTYSGIGYTAGEGGQIWITRDSGWTWELGPKAGGTVLGVDEIGDGHR